MIINRSWIDRWVAAINGDAACINTGRGFNCAFTLAIGSERYTLTVHNGRVETVVDNGGPLVASAFTLIADQQTWNNMFAPNPPPMGHAIFAAIGAGTMQFEGDIRPVFQQMTTMSAWLDVARALNGVANVAANPDWHDEWQAVGRYVNVSVDSVQHKVFYFEAGQGIPVLCQHTAGNENRQWRHCPTTRTLDARCTSHSLIDGAQLPLQRVMSNSFGFGGSNCSLILGRLP